MGNLARLVFGLREKSHQGTRKPIEQTKKRAYEIRTVNDISYFKTFLAQLEEVAQQPVKVASQAEMIEQIGNQNAHREILSVLKKDLETAERFIAGDQDRQRSS